MGTLHKLLLADVAGEGALSGVYSQMLHQVAALQECLGALWALVAPDALVCLAVFHQHLLVGKGDPAVLTHKGPLLSMATHVPRQITTSSKRHWAQRALKRGLFVMGQQVLLEQSLMAEHLVAH